MSAQSHAIRLERNGCAGVGLTEMECHSEGFQSALPTQRVHVCYRDDDAGFSIGVCDTTAMQEAFDPYPGDEFIWALEGKFKMLDGAGGLVAEVKQGQSTCFRNAVAVSWKQEGYLNKFYITCLEPKAEAPGIASVRNCVPGLNPDAALQPLNDAAPTRAHSVHQRRRYARAFRAGAVGVNACSEGEISTPFGGFNASGIGGRDNGIHAHEQYTELKTIRNDLSI